MQAHHCHHRSTAGLLAWRNALLSAGLVCGLVWVAAAPGARGADEPARAEVVKAAVSVSALQPGKPATAAVVVDIKKGFHSQSHTPSQSFLIPFKIKLDDSPALKFGEPVYPRGEDYDTKSADLGIINVYEGRVVVRFPVEVKPDAAPGHVKITGKLTLQICNDTQCYAPVKPPFEISTSIVAAGQGVKANEPELFPDGGAPVARPTTDPAAAPAGPGGAPESAAPVAPKAASYTVLGAFALAFLAGLVFNVMPCVLPVLPLKAMGFYEASQHNRARSLALGAGFSLGVVASFALLGLLVVVKQVFKWGEIFSNPWFLGGLVVVLLVMALYTFGLFTIRLPNAIYSVSPRHDTFFGNILFGILTAALSTPCTFGMFVGLLGFALTQTTAVGMALMITVGVGMAFPYFVLSAFPEVARRFPRTGPWSELVKQFLGFVLLGTAVYFAEPFLERVISTRAFWWLLFAIVVASAVFVVARSLQFSKSRLGPAVAVLIAVAMVVPAYAAAHRLTLRPYTWQPFTPKALDAARASNQVVVLEFTASWCTTCHTLEAAVLNDPKVIEAVSHYGVKMMRADVTADDAPGWAKLKELHAEGVPLTVVYAPGSASPVQLAGLYGSKELRAVIAAASKQKPGTAVAQGG